MARRVHAEGQRERQNMRDYDPSGKWDVGYWEDGEWNHITRVPTEAEAIETARRLDDPPEDAQHLIGLTGDEEIETVQR